MARLDCFVGIRADGGVMTITWLSAMANCSEQGVSYGATRGIHNQLLVGENGCIGFEDARPPSNLVIIFNFAYKDNEFDVRWKQKKKYVRF